MISTSSHPTHTHKHPHLYQLVHSAVQHKPLGQVSKTEQPIVPQDHEGPSDKAQAQVADDSPSQPHGHASHDGVGTTTDIGTNAFEEPDKTDPTDSQVHDQEHVYTSTGFETTSPGSASVAFDLGDGDDDKTQLTDTNSWCYLY